MNSARRIGVWMICLAVAASALVPLGLRAAAPTPATPVPSPLKPTASADELMKKVASLDEKISNLMPTPKLLANEEFRKGDGQKVRPLMVEAVTVMGDLEKAIKTDARLKDATDLVDEVHTGRLHAMAWASVLGDKETADALEAQSKEKGAEGTAATAALTLVKWITTSNDAAAQQKVLDDFTPVAKVNADNDEVLATLAVMINLGAANGDMEKKVVEVIRGNMKSAMAKDLLAQIDGEMEQKALVGKPLTIAGRTSTGGTFDSSSYKGKVVMLDFWATWCGPCIQELPNVKAAYKEFHEKGFEIVGLSCDSNDEVLNKFTQEKDMPWVQLRETSQTERTAENPKADNWHPLAKKYHVDGIPQMFLIDRNGVLRFVDAREDLAKKVAQLIAEPVKADAPAPK